MGTSSRGSVVPVVSDLRHDLEIVISALQAVVARLPTDDLPAIIVDAIATKGRTKGQQDDLWASALASLRAGEDANAIADAIYRGELSDDGE